MNAPYREKNLTGVAAPQDEFRVPTARGGLARLLRRRTFWVALALILFALFVWALRPASNGRSGRGSTETGPVPVGIAMSQASDVHVRLDALGTVTPLATVTVKPEVNGLVDKIDFKEGQMVRAGDVLVEIDPRPYQAVLDQAKGALARDEAQLANARIDQNRYQALWSQSAISQQILATQEALVRTDSGTVEADKAAVEAAAVNVGFCKIRSPVNGEVGLRQVDLGNYVQVGVTTGIVVVTQLQPMSVLFALPEDDIARIEQHVRAGDPLSVDVFDRSQSVKLATGTLATVDNEVDPTTGTLKLRALFDNADNRLFPSQFVNIRLLVDTLHRQTTVPAAAIQHGSSGDYVFLVNADRTVAMRAVTLGPTDGDEVDVTRGLVPGEKVVVDGADRLQDGSRVLLPGAKSSAYLKGESRSHAAPSGRHHHRRGGGVGGGE